MLVPQPGTAHSNCRQPSGSPRWRGANSHWLPARTADNCLNPMVRDDVPAGQASTPTASTPMANAASSRHADRPSPLGMSYPQAQILHAVGPGSIRYGRTTLRPFTGPARPLTGTVRARARTVGHPGRNQGGGRRVLLGMIHRVHGARPSAPAPAPSSRWYERELGWPTAGSDPVELLTGVAFDVIELRPWPDGRCCGAYRGPVRSRWRAPGCGFWWPLAAPTSFRGCSTGWSGAVWPWTWARSAPHGRITAPCPSRSRPPLLDAGAPGERGPQEAAVWLRPPDPKGEVEPTLPRTGFGGDGGAPDLVRLVNAAATECHRIRLMRARPLPRQRRAGKG